MSPDDARAFSLELAKTAELFGEPLTETRILLYFEALFDLPLETVIAGLKLARQRNRFFPKPGEVYELVSGTPADQAEIAWSRCLDAIRNQGSYVTVDFGDAALHETIRVMWGGWHEAWRLETSDLPYKHAEFLKVYRAMARRGLTLAGPMKGLIAIDNESRGFLEWVPKAIDLTRSMPKALPEAILP